MSFNSDNLLFGCNKRLNVLLYFSSHSKSKIDAYNNHDRIPFSDTFLPRFGLYVDQISTNVGHYTGK